MENKIIDADLSYIDSVSLIEDAEIFIPWSKDAIKSLLKEDNIIFRVLLNDNDVIGYYSFAHIVDEGHINNIAVKKEYQSKGFGTMLMNDMIDIAKQKNIVALTLEVEEGNDKAINLYKKFDFKVEGVRKKYYKNTKDALIMWRR